MIEESAVRPTDDGVEQRVDGVGEELLEEEGDEEARCEEAESGSRRTKNVADPLRPKQSKVEEHNKTHLPFRNWCSFCVRGRGKEKGGRRFFSPRPTAPKQSPRVSTPGSLASPPRAPAYAPRSDQRP